MMRNTYICPASEDIACMGTAARPYTHRKLTDNKTKQEESQEEYYGLCCNRCRRQRIEDGL